YYRKSKSSNIRHPLFHHSSNPSLFVGFYLIGRALLDLKEGLGGKSKDFSKAGIGIVIGLVGGLIGWWGVNNILNFFKTNGQQIPKA
ncbi:hypothetical protein ACSLPC_28240, partial [Escherichia coli]|uniref:hypothetical protein n=1 Tax=Escherichia coli TaxID=562 RepID=UPI003EE16CD7